MVLIEEFTGLALIKITKSPYQNEVTGEISESLALIKITKSPYQDVETEIQEIV